MDFHLANTNMIKTQLMPSGIHQAEIIQAYQTLKRECFVPDAYQAQSWTDMRIPLAEHAHMLKPREEALMLQMLKPQRTDKALLLGAGSGFSAALLASMTQSVDAIEIDDALSENMVSRWQAQGIHNARLHVQDAITNIPSEPVDIIWATFATPGFPDEWFDVLNEGGRMLAIMDEGDIQRAMLFTKGEDDWQEQILMELETDLARGHVEDAFSF